MTPQTPKCHHNLGCASNSVSVPSTIPWHFFSEHFQHKCFDWQTPYLRVPLLTNITMIIKKFQQNHIIIQFAMCSIISTAVSLESYLVDALKSCWRAATPVLERLIWCLNHQWYLSRDSFNCATKWQSLQEGNFACIMPLGSGAACATHCRRQLLTEISFATLLSPVLLVTTLLLIWILPYTTLRRSSTSCFLIMLRNLL